VLYLVAARPVKTGTPIRLRRENILAERADTFGAGEQLGKMRIGGQGNNAFNRPSLYAAFGNKEQLFRKALDRYQTGPQSFLDEALEKPTARAVAKAIFSGGRSGSSSSMPTNSKWWYATTPARAVHWFGGTGKAIVALHRAVDRARTNLNARVLLNTFPTVWPMRSKPS
jgi:hypothetical protein